MRNLLMAAMVVLFFTMITYAQNTEPASLTYGKVAQFQSKTLNENRRINIYLPPGYDGSKDKYPVLYLLDGSAHEDYFHVAGLIDFLATYQVMPSTIVIGISNVDRKRDFTPPSEDKRDLEAAPTSGGADKFITFLATELIPYVNTNYRTNNTNTIVGQSLGGLLVTKILLEKPELFNNYVIVSPSLWWNNQKMLQSAAAEIKKHPTADRKIYLTVANEHPEMKATAQSLSKLLQESNWPNLKFHYDYLDNENHATSLHISIYRAIDFLYQMKKF